MTITESLFKEIELGRQGKNVGFSMGLPKLESIIDGVTKQTYTVVFSNSGSGKSTEVLFSYIYKPLQEHLEDNKYRVWLASLEMNPDMVFGKLLTMYIFEHYGIEVSVKELLSRRKGHILSDKLYNIVQECKPWLEKIESKVTVYDKALNAKVLYSLLLKELEKIGTFKEDEHRKTYIPNDPDLIFTVIIDHIGICRPSDGHTLKQEIDLISQYLLTLRNMCGISPVVVQQANRDQGSIERFKASRTGFTINDTKDSGGPVTDAEVVLAIYNPHRDKLNTYGNGYDIKKLRDKFRTITVLKSRYGESDVEIAVNFFGKCGIWHELPLPNDIYDYDKYLTPDYILNDKEDKKIEEVDNVNKNEFKLIV